MPCPTPREISLVPVPQAERNTNPLKKRPKDFRLRPGILVPTPEEHPLMLRNAAGAATLTLVLMMMLMLAFL
jgi:hypothetical protein